ncbi:MAG: M28 family peptidase [Spirochaetales bacterium]|nr:M28 family peptidase [Spirochaetales bacterium]
MNGFDPQRAWELLVTFAASGKRPPGTAEHKAAITDFFHRMQPLCRTSWLQEFSLPFRGTQIQCANVCGLIKGRNPEFTILLGSHFDTRWIADNEADPAQRNIPIPGVNDGTSGVAVILELMRAFSETEPATDVVFVLFDAEDVGNIDGYEFGVGAEIYAKEGRVKPDLVIALDMVGGLDMHLNIDFNSCVTGMSKGVLKTIFSIGRGLGFPCFFNNTVNAVIGDHYPFIRSGIPAVILIDIDYPQWHTQQDTIDHCSRDSLFYVGEVLYRFLSAGPRGEDVNKK